MPSPWSCCKLIHEMIFSNLIHMHFFYVKLWGNAVQIVDNKSLCLINERIFILSGAYVKGKILATETKTNKTCPGLSLNSTGRV